ncbi:MAG: protein kinase domain-containing protein [Candidatus Thorarchaeota archaeon]
MKKAKKSFEGENAPKQGSKEFFIMLLKNPIVKKKLPSDFNIEEEAAHLESLYQRIPRMSEYIFSRFVHAGGSGMVFKVFVADEPTTPLAMKIVRYKLYKKMVQNANVAQTLSAISQTELRALEIISHPHVVCLHDTIAEDQSVIAIITTFIDPPTRVDDFLHEILKHSPSAKTGLKLFSPARLDRACEFLIDRFTEIASALVHIHGLKDGKGIFHFDIKPANILIARSKSVSDPNIFIYAAVLTDMGSCIHGDLVESLKEIRVYFSLPYAHPDLRDLVHDPHSITGGLKMSANIEPKKGLAKYDLYAFGKTIQHSLAILHNAFGERCYASYGFRYLHVISCMLLDGRNLLGSEPTVSHDGLSFVNDLALHYPLQLWAKHKITSMEELLYRLKRFTREFSWNDVAPELDTWQPRRVNCVAHAPAPFTGRVAEVMNHPCVRRLKSELQLGWIREVFPGASHDRWSHCLGTFSALIGYYNSLLSDPEVPTFRIFVDKDDLSHAFVAALIHDLGQTTFGHDFEEACPSLFRHEDFTHKLLQDKRWSEITLADTIKRNWEGIKVSRIVDILKMSSNTYADERRQTDSSPRNCIDGVAADIINGPIDADKADYLLRDSIACGVPYGHGIDTRRFLQALTVSASADPHLRLAYKAKGRPAVASLLLARYQMYGAVYWHHTFRCIQAMFVHAAATAFSKAATTGIVLNECNLTSEDIKRLFYERVICRSTWKRATDALHKSPTAWKSDSLWKDPPPVVSIEPSLDFVWQFSDKATQQLVERLAQRKLYKRVFELPLGHLYEPDYTATANELSGPNRLDKAQNLQNILFEEVSNAMRNFDDEITGSASTTQVILNNLRTSEVPLVVLDFPVRVLKEYNIPKELEDPVRKYFTISISHRREREDIVSTIMKLQKNIATVRVFADPDFHELIIRYLKPEVIKKCVELTIPSLRQTE